MLWIAGITQAQWDRMIQRLSRIEYKLDELLQIGDIELADLARITADVAAETTVVDSVKTLLDQLTAAIGAIHTEDPATQVALDALATQIETNSAALTAAVAANTPAAPAPTP